MSGLDDLLAKIDRLKRREAALIRAIKALVSPDLYQEGVWTEITVRESDLAEAIALIPEEEK